MTEEVESNYFALKKDHPLAKELTKTYRWYSTKFSPRDIPRFADVGSITESPTCMKGIRDFLVARYRAMPELPTHIMGFEARGFLFGPMVAVELGIPFVLMRKANKNPGVLIKSEPYDKVYKEVAPEIMTVRLGSIGKGSRVVLIDDVLSSGGTVLSGLQLVEASGATTLEVVVIVSIYYSKGVNKIHNTENGRYKNIPFFSFVNEDILSENNCGDPKDYIGSRIISCTDALVQNQL